LRERVISKSVWPRHDELFAALQDRYPPPAFGFIIHDLGDSWHVTVNRGDNVDLDTGLQSYESYQQMDRVYWVEVTATRQDSKPIQVKCGEYQVWCYATAPMQALVTVGKVTVGQKVLVAFIDGDRSMPVVIG